MGKQKRSKISNAEVVIILVSAGVVYLASASIGQRIAPGAAGLFLAAAAMIVLVGYVLSTFRMLPVRADRLPTQIVAGILTAIGVICGGTAVMTAAAALGIDAVAYGPAAAMVQTGALTGFTQVLYVLACVLLIPAAEELVFRAAVFGAIRERVDFVYAAAASSAVFAIVHGIGPMTLTAFLAGFLLCELYELTGNVAAVILVHVLNNLFSLSAGFGISGLAVWGIVLGGLAVSAGILVLLWRVISNTLNGYDERKIGL